MNEHSKKKMLLIWRKEAYVDSRHYLLQQWTSKVLELADHFEVSWLSDLTFQGGILTRQYGIATLLNPYGRPFADSLNSYLPARPLEDAAITFNNTSPLSVDACSGLASRRNCSATIGKALLEDIHDLFIYWWWDPVLHALLWLMLLWVYPHYCC